MEAIHASILAALFGALLSFFIATVSSSRRFNNIVKGDIRQHEFIYHKAAENPTALVAALEEKVNKKLDEKNEAIYNRLNRIDRAITWLVSAQGGNLRDLDLG